MSKSPAMLIYCYNCQRWCASKSTKLKRKTCPICQATINVNNAPTEIAPTLKAAMDLVKKKNEKPVTETTAADLLEKKG